MTEFEQRVAEVLRVQLRSAAGGPFDETPTIEQLADRVAPRVAAAIDITIPSAMGIPTPMIDAVQAAYRAAALVALRGEQP